MRELGAAAGAADGPYTALVDVRGPAGGYPCGCRAVPGDAGGPGCGLGRGSRVCRAAVPGVPGLLRLAGLLVAAGPGGAWSGAAAGRDGPWVSGVRRVASVAPFAQSLPATALPMPITLTLLPQTFTGASTGASTWLPEATPGESVVYPPAYEPPEPCQSPEPPGLPGYPKPPGAPESRDRAVARRSRRGRRSRRAPPYPEGEPYPPCPPSSPYPPDEPWPPWPLWLPWFP